MTQGGQGKGGDFAPGKILPDLEAPDGFGGIMDIGGVTRRPAWGLPLNCNPPARRRPSSVWRIHTQYWVLYVDVLSKHIVKMGEKRKE